MAPISIGALSDQEKQVYKPANQGLVRQASLSVRKPDESGVIHMDCTARDLGNPRKPDACVTGRPENSSILQKGLTGEASTLACEVDRVRCCSRNGWGCSHYYHQNLPGYPAAD